MIRTNPSFIVESEKKSIKKEFNLTAEDVADLMDVDYSVVKQCMDLFVSSFVKPSTDEKK